VADWERRHHQDPALPCPALPCPALPCPALPCPALPCPALPCPALPCPALPCPVLRRTLARPASTGVLLHQYWRCLTWHTTFDLPHPVLCCAVLCCAVLCRQAAHLTPPSLSRESSGTHSNIGQGSLRGSLDLESRIAAYRRQVSTTSTSTGELVLCFHGARSVRSLYINPRQPADQCNPQTAC
jgi:hypothetical protein